MNKTAWQWPAATVQLRSLSNYRSEEMRRLFIYQPKSINSYLQVKSLHKKLTDIWYICILYDKEVLEDNFLEHINADTTYHEDTGQTTLQEWLQVGTIYSIPHQRDAQMQIRFASCTMSLRSITAVAVNSTSDVEDQRSDPAPTLTLFNYAV